MDKVVGENQHRDEPKEYYWRNGGCALQARRLFFEYRGGQIFLVNDHFYFVPPSSDVNELALNSIDNGYNYPQLTVAEVIQGGVEVSPFEI